jgi:phosphohistidine phosphatase
MRQLYLIRHAEAANRLLIQTDLERTLTAKGLLDAQRLGHYLAQHAIDQIIYSHAVRTTQTAHAINQSLQLASGRLVKSSALYHADVTTLLHVAQAIEDHVSKVAMVAHNPTISALASTLSRERVTPFSPAQVVALAFNIDSWNQLRQQSGQLRFVYVPGEK